MVSFWIPSAFGKSFVSVQQIAEFPLRILDFLQRKQAARNAVADLLELDDRLLTDIGLYRTEIAEIASRLGAGTKRVR